MNSENVGEERRLANTIQLMRIQKTLTAKLRLYLQFPQIMRAGQKDGGTSLALILWWGQRLVTCIVVQLITPRVRMHDC